MKKIYLLCLMLICSLASIAQDFEITSVESLPNDFAAREEMKTDHNDRQCSLLRVATQNIAPEQREGFTFKTDLGSEIVERATRNGEIWLWVSPGLKYLRIMHREWGQYELHLLDHVSRVEALHTYKITIRGIQSLVAHEQGKVTPTQQYLMFQITPANALLEVDGQLWSVDADGTAMKYVDFGTYNYRVMASDYFTETGKVTVNDPENTKIVPVSLKPNFAEITLVVDADAEIWVNNQKKGTRRWTGSLGNGTYKIECKQANHETSMVSKEITPAMNGQTITLPAPTPIYGSLNIESTPNLATVYIDGKEVGKTPKSIPQIIIGQHEIKLLKDGCAEHIETIIITKGERKQLSATLSSGKEIQFTCNVPNAQLEIDGKKVSSANGTYMLTYGQHIVKASANNYREYTYAIIVNESSDQCHNIVMNKPLEKEMTFTVKGISFIMKPVEGGTFKMGATSEQYQRGTYIDNSEKPVHDVTLNDYYIGETEVTQALWTAVMETDIEKQRNRVSFEWEKQPLKGVGNNYPMYYVNWHDCQEFIFKLNKITGKKFRLPTEAEWEYAARGGNKSKGFIYAGSNSVDEVAWNCYNSGDKYLTEEDRQSSGMLPTDKNNNKPHLVRGKVPNELGLYDMSGNVSEWCNDWYDTRYYSKSPLIDPHGPIIDQPRSGNMRVYRGGGYEGCFGVSFRYSTLPTFRCYSIGFRLVLSEINGNGTKDNSNEDAKAIRTPSRVNEGIPQGALLGKFSVNSTKQVHFSQGNLQYQTSTNKWRFAEHQWDVLGEANKNASVSYNSWIDLFGWGTGDNPTKTSTNINAYSIFTDWGINMGNGWRTLTDEEWKYVFNERNTSSGIRYAKAIVEDVSGVILLPDDWNSSTYVLYGINDSKANYNSNLIPLSVWNSIFEQEGAAFLPVANCWRIGDSVYNIGDFGLYWSSTPSDSEQVHCLQFTDSFVAPGLSRGRTVGVLVRLVCPVEN